MMPVSIASVLILCLARTAVSDKYVSRRFDEEEILDALDLANSARSDLSKRKKGRGTFPLPADLTVAEKWYDPVDFSKTRYNAIAQLLMIPYAAKEKKETPVADQPGMKTVEVSYKFDGGKLRPKYCSAFYVSPTIIATAAHCFRDVKITPTSKHVIIVRQQHDGSKEFTHKLAEKFERVIVEWIYNANYDNLPADRDWHPLSGLDYAFARVNAPNEGNVYYTLTPPEKVMTTAQPNPKIQVVGYPEEYGDYDQAASVSCELAKIGDTIAKRNKALKLLLKDKDEKYKVDDVKDTQLFCIGDKGNSQHGSSGGPWLLDEPGLAADSDNVAKLRWVVGLSGWVIKRTDIKVGKDSPQYHSEFMKEQAYCKAGSCAWLKQRQVSELEALKTAAGKPWKEVLEAL